MKSCPYCGNRIEDEAIYCRYCKKVIQPKLTISSDSHPKTEKGSTLNYDYKLEFNVIIKDGSINIQNLENLAFICRDNYEFSDRLTSKTNELRENYFQNFLGPTVYQFKFGKAAGDVFRDHLIALDGLYFYWEQVILAMNMELRRGNVAVNQCTAFCRDITDDVFTSFILGTINTEKRFLAGDLEEITDFAFDKFSLIRTPFIELARDITTIAREESDNTKIKKNHKEQSTFYLEVMKFIKVND